MKLILSILTAYALTLSLLNAKPNDNMTDIEDPRSYAKEMFSTQTPDFKCNYYADMAGENLWNMAEAEDTRNNKLVSLEFSNFQRNAESAIEACKYVDEQLTREMIVIVEGVNYYYKYEIKKIKK